MITRNLGLFANLKLTLTDAVLAEKLAGVRETFSGEFSGQLPVLILLGGAEDGKVFPLRHETIAIGRWTPTRPAGRIMTMRSCLATTTRQSPGYQGRTPGSPGGTTPGSSRTAAAQEGPSSTARSSTGADARNFTTETSSNSRKEHRGRPSSLSFPGRCCRQMRPEPQDGRDAPPSWSCSPPSSSLPSLPPSRGPGDPPNMQTPTPGASRPPARPRQG